MPSQVALDRRSQLGTQFRDRGFDKGSLADQRRILHAIARASRTLDAGTATCTTAQPKGLDSEL